MVPVQALKVSKGRLRASHPASVPLTRPPLGNPLWLPMNQEGESRGKHRSVTGGGNRSAAGLGATRRNQEEQIEDHPQEDLGVSLGFFCRVGMT